jgi:hypothetical protein
VVAAVEVVEVVGVVEVGVPTLKKEEEEAAGGNLGGSRWKAEMAVVLTRKFAGCGGGGSVWWC